MRDNRRIMLLGDGAHLRKGAYSVGKEVLHLCMLLYKEPSLTPIHNVGMHFSINLEVGRGCYSSMHVRTYVSFAFINDKNEACIVNPVPLTTH